MLRREKVHFEQHWDKIVTCMERCIGLIDDGDKDRNKQVDEINFQIESLKVKKEQFC